MSKPDDIETIRRKVAVAEALEYGRLAEDQFESAAIISNKPSRLYFLFRLLGGSSYAAKQTNRSLTTEQARRIADSLDEFAPQLASAAEQLNDGELGVAAAQANRWGTDLWKKDRDPREIYGDLKTVLATLNRHSAQIFDGRGVGSTD